MSIKIRLKLSFLGGDENKIKDLAKFLKFLLKIC